MAEMDGIQQTVYLGLKHMMESVETGRYGHGDDFDAEVFLDDLESEVSDVTN